MTKKVQQDTDYHDELIQMLQDHDLAVEYLNQAFEESSKKGDDESHELLLTAMRNVAEAQGGLGKLAMRTHIRREILYRILSPEGNPTLKNFATLVRALGLQLRFC